MNLKFRDKVIGDLEDNVFRKKVKGSKHLMINLDAWGIDEEVFKKHLLPTNAEIRILDVESDIVFITTASVYDAHGIRKAFGEYGRQIFLPRKYFELKSKNQQKLI